MIAGLKWIDDNGLCLQLGEADVGLVVYATNIFIWRDCVGCKQGECNTVNEAKAACEKSVRESIGWEPND